MIMMMMMMMMIYDIQYLNLHDLGHWYSLQDKLGDAVTSLYFEVCIAVIEQNNTYISPIIIVYHASSDVDRIFPCEAASTTKIFKII